LARVGVKAKVGLRRRQRDVDDRHVEDDHQLRDRDYGEDAPAALVMPVCLSLS